MTLFFLRIFAKFAIWLRYRVHLRGLEDIKKLGNKSIIFLPNHPCLMDPVIVSTMLMKDFNELTLIR